MNVIYTGFDGAYTHIVDTLYKEHKWKPVCILGNLETREWAESYKDCLFFECIKLRNSQFDYSKMKKAPIDSEIIKGMSEKQSYCMNQMIHQDTTGWNFSFNERLNYYYDLLNFFNSIIKHTKPGLFTADSTPHMVPDYTFYQMCKYFNIPTLHIDFVPLFDYGKNKWNFISPSIEEPHKAFEEIYNSFNYILKEV